jgi:hypothetical protein
VSVVVKNPFAVYTERGERKRIISARLANKAERRSYYGNYQIDGKGWSKGDFGFWEKFWGFKMLEIERSVDFPRVDLSYFCPCETKKKSRNKIEKPRRRKAIRVVGEGLSAEWIACG